MYRRRRGFRTGRGRTTRSLATNALRLARRNTRLVGKPEFKFIEETPAYTNVIDTGHVKQLTDIDQGDTASTRTGNTVRIKSFWIKWYCIYDTDNLPTISWLRIMFFIDTEQRGTAPGNSDLLGSVTIQGFKNDKYKRRFVILYDRTYWMDGAERKILMGEWYHRFNMLSDYADSQGSNPIGNHLYMFVMSEDPVNGPYFKGKFVTKFTDV